MLSYRIGQTTNGGVGDNTNVSLMQTFYFLKSPAERVERWELTE